MLAEDNLINQKVAVAMLASAGYRVDVVRTGEAAVAALAAHTYDAVLMDCQMPDLNGYEATAVIRSGEEPGHHIPIIAMTAGARREDRDRCLAAGMDSYLAKPVSKDALLALVAQSVQGGPARDGWQAPAPVIPADAPWPDPGPPLDPAVVTRLRRLGTEAGEDLMGQLAALFLESTEDHLDTVRLALGRHDAAAVAHAAHSLRGAGANLGATHLALVCATLEQCAAEGDLAEAEVVTASLAAEVDRVRAALRPLALTS